MKMIICKGLPGSGKSTWAREFVEKNPEFVRVNRDDLRNMRGFYWLPKQEDMISDWEFNTVNQALLNGYNVVLDSTNLNEKYLESIKGRIRRNHAGIEFEVKDFDLSPEECIKRDLKRVNSVGADVIWRMYYKYVNPPKRYLEDTLLPRCILVDIDGTLAEIVTNRSPFDWQRVGEDTVQQHIKMIVNSYAEKTPPDNNVILFSGRDECCAEITSEWLVNKNIAFHKLFMRKTGDNRKDALVKREMFENHVLGKYFVDFVIDDRPQVLRMWVGLGLKVISNNPLNKEF